MALRARLETAKFSHAGFGLPLGDVMISTVSPVFNLVRSGTGMWFTFAPMQRLPMSVWMA